MSRPVKIDSFQLIGFDEGGLREGPRGDLRLVCNAQSGEKIAIFGSAQARSNIDAVLNARMPCTVNCETRPPADWAIDRYGHTHWVPESSALHIMAPTNTAKDSNHSHFLGVDLNAWVYDTIKKVEAGNSWNAAWEETYWKLGGKSVHSGRKGCPMIGTKTLYLLGRIKNSDMAFQNLPLRDVWNNYSKNGAYSILALEGLSQNPDISRTELWRYIQHRVREELGEDPAHSNQGGPTVAFKLWHLGMINQQ